MAEGDARTVSAKPLRERLGTQRGAKAEAARRMNVTPATLSNWLRRGVPLAQVPVVATFMGITRDIYLELAGVHATSTTYHTLDENSLLKAITELWPAIPASTKRALATIARDVTRGFWERRVAQIGTPGRAPYNRRASDHRPN